MIHTYNVHKETWVDLDNPTGEEISSVVGQYDLDPYVQKELTAPTPKPRIEFHKEYVYMILHWPAFKHTHGASTKQEIDFVIGKQFLITTRYDTIDAIHRISKQFEVEEILSKPQTLSGYHLFTLVFKELYASIGEELAYIEDWADRITEDIFDGNEKEMVIEISEAIRILLDFKKTTDTHKEILDFLKEGGAHIFDKDFGEEIESIILEYHRLREIIRAELEVLRELRETNNSLLSTKENETIKKLSVFTFIAIPISIIFDLLNLHVDSNPFLSHPLGFYVILAILLVATLIMYILTRYKKWL